MHKAQQQQQQHSPGGSVQAFYRQNRGSSCRKIMRFNGYPNKVSGRRKGCVRTLIGAAVKGRQWLGPPRGLHSYVYGKILFEIITRATTVL